MAAIDAATMKGSIEDRLLLTRARAFDFDGFVEGCGFAVRVDLDLTGAEFWGVLRHWGDMNKKGGGPEGPSVLVVHDVLGSYAWAPWSVDDVLWKVPDDFGVVSVEDLREAVQLALDLADGRVAPSELVDYRAA